MRTKLYLNLRLASAFLSASPHCTLRATEHLGTIQADGGLEGHRLNGLFLILPSKSGQGMWLARTIQGGTGETARGPSQHLLVARDSRSVCIFTCSNCTRLLTASRVVIETVCTARSLGNPRKPHYAVCEHQTPGGPSPPTTSAAISACRRTSVRSSAECRRNRTRYPSCVRDRPTFVALHRPNSHNDNMRERDCHRNRHHCYQVKSSLTVLFQFCSWTTRVKC